MPRPKVFTIGLSAADREFLSKLTVTGMHPARMIIRARVLLELDENAGPVADRAVIADRVGVSQNTVRSIAKRFGETDGDVLATIARKRCGWDRAAPTLEQVVDVVACLMSSATRSATVGREGAGRRPRLPETRRRGESRRSCAAPSRCARAPTPRTAGHTARHRAEHRSPSARLGSASAGAPACPRSAAIGRSPAPRRESPDPSRSRQPTRTGTTATGPTHKNGPSPPTDQPPADPADRPRPTPPRPRRHRRAGRAPTHRPSRRHGQPAPRPERSDPARPPAYVDQRDNRLIVTEQQKHHE
jgi:hypothetical protein